MHVIRNRTLVNIKRQIWEVKGLLKQTHTLARALSHTHTLALARTHTITHTHTRFHTVHHRKLILKLKNDSIKILK